MDGRGGQQEGEEGERVGRKRGGERLEEKKEMDEKSQKMLAKLERRV